MTKLILINGLGGAGKDTTGQVLLSVIPNSALIDIKGLSRTNPWEFHDYEIGLKNMAALIHNFTLEHNTIICTGGIFSQNRLDYLQNLLDIQHIYIYFFWLDVEKIIRDKRRIQRKRDNGDNTEFLDHIDSIFTDPGTLNIQNGQYIRIHANSLTTAEVVKTITKTIS